MSQEAPAPTPPPDDAPATLPVAPALEQESAHQVPMPPATTVDAEALVQRALRWQHRHPMARRLRADAVQGIGLVALPFMREAGAGPDTPASELRPVFSETFIEGLSPEAVARLAQAHGVPRVAQEWPERHVGVDAVMAERVVGGWPVELWLASLALEHPQGTRRLLLGLQAPEAPTAQKRRLKSQPGDVMGQRLMDWRRWAVALALGVLTLGLLTWGGLRLMHPPKPAVRSIEVRGVVQGLPADAAVAATSPSSSPASNPTINPTSPLPDVKPPAPDESASQPAEAASPPAAAPAPAPASAPPTLNPRPEAPAEAGPPLVDIRPQIGRARPRIEDSKRSVEALPRPAEHAAEKAPPSAAPAPAPAKPLADTPKSGAPQAENGSVIALVSPPFKKRSEAEAWLKKMREQAAATVPDGRLQAEVLDSPQGFRAALFPFNSREEAQVLNLTLVARGLKTRPMAF